MSGKRKRGGAKGAFGSFMKVLLLFIVIPMAIYYYAIPYAYDIIAEAMTDAMAETSSEVTIKDIPMMDQIEPYLKRMTTCAVPLVIIAIPMGYFPRGDKRKIPCRLAFGIVSAALIWITAKGGKLSLTLSDIEMMENLDISSIDLGLDITMIIYAAMALCVLRGLLGFLEYRAFRSELSDGA